MKGVRMSKELADEMVDHLNQARPNEGCGILAAKDGVIVKVFKMTNAAASPLRYSLDSDEQFAAYKKIDDEGWELAGVFHSHTRTEAYPSPTDIHKAIEDVPYVIVSLAQESPSIRAFRITKENWSDTEGVVEEVPVVVEG